MASIEELKARVKALDEKVDSVRPANIIVLEMLEELGEISHSMIGEMGHKGHRSIRGSIEEEVGDLFYLLLRLAYTKDIDLEKQLEYTMHKIDGGKTWD